MLYLIVFLGAGIGGALRHGVNVGAARVCQIKKAALDRLRRELADAV